MARRAREITASDDQIILLKTMSSGPDRSISLRAQIILECLKEPENKKVAAHLNIDENTVRKWKDRFIENGVSGLQRIHGGGKQSSVMNTEILDAQIIEAVSISDDWTITSLAKALHTTEYAVKMSLQRQGIEKRRVHTWSIPTANELVVKVADVRALYISSKEKAVIVCCNKKGLRSGKGKVTTRNRLMAEEMNGSSTVLTLADSLVAAERHNSDHITGKTESLSTFLSSTITLFPDEADTEYHVFACTQGDFSYNNWKMATIHCEVSKNTDAWLYQLGAWLLSMYTDAQFQVAKDLLQSIRTYLSSCTDSSEPFCWRKVLDDDGGDGKETELSSEDGVIKDVLSKIEWKNETGKDGVLVKAVLLLKDGANFHAMPSEITAVLPNPEEFDYTSLEGFTDSVSVVEDSIEKFFREFELQMMRDLLAEVKKTQGHLV